MTPTNNFRWLSRDKVTPIKGTDLMAVEAGADTRLQQWWHFDGFSHNHATGDNGTWRDVPIVEAK